MNPARAYAAFDKSSPLRPFDLKRRAPGPRDVAFDVLFCGVCHSDLHTARSEWPGTVYPCVPGHEIVGQVTAVGASVKKFEVGGRVAVGCMVDSCRTCASCKEGLEQYCDEHATVFTYNGPDKHGAGPVTYGGYSSQMVVDEDFCLRVPANLDLAAAAPLLCAGVTTWSPLKHWGAGPGKAVGVVGLGGLGHMALKLAHALGAHTTLFTTSAGKVADAKRLGADEVVISKDAAAMQKHSRRLDLIIDTVSASHDLDAFTNLLRRDGTLVLVGVPEHGHPSPSVMPLVLGRRAIAGSLIGGIRETQEMLDFCGEKGVVADIEKIGPHQIDEAYERMLKSDVQYRFVIDMAPLRG